MFVRKEGKIDDVIVKHKGIFKKRIGLFQAVALIVSGTIGAGVLGIPYAVAQVGVGIGILYIVILGFALTILNLMIGEIVVRTKGEFQLVGLAKKYLGKYGEWMMTLLVYLMSLGALVIYIIGEGDTLQALFGGNAFLWSVLFFAIGGIIISIGLQMIKVVDFFLSICILTIIFVIAFFSSPHIVLEHVQYYDLAKLLLPYGVILFAFSGAVTIPEAHAILKRRDTLFKKSIIIAGIINTIVYVVFAYVVVGVTGLETTEIATIGLGEKVGNGMLIFGNIFAMLAMATSFLMVGIAFKDSLRWDYKLSKWKINFIVLFVPFLIFFLGLRDFIQAINIVGGIFVSLQLLLLVLIYWRAKQLGHLKKSKYKLHHTSLLIALIVFALSIGAVYSVIKLF